MTVRTTKTRGKPPAGPSIIADYRLQPGVPDEMMDEAGNIRPGWAELMAAFDALGPTELGAQHLDLFLRPGRARGVAKRLRLGDRLLQVFQPALVAAARLLVQQLARVAGVDRLVRAGMWIGGRRRGDHRDEPA